MHIPDGMLSTPVALITGGGALASVSYAVSWAKRYLPERKVVLMATLGALIFALQMLDFPVAVGTSGHFGGGTLAAVTLGFWPAQIVMTAVLAIQALFNDGGIIAFGANVLNLAIIGPGVGYGIYRLAIRIKDNRTSRLIGAGVGAWLAAIASAAAVGIEIGLSGNAHLTVVTGAMIAWHAIIGIGEALITVALLSYLFTVRPDLVDSSLGSSNAGKQRRRISNKALALTLGIIAILAAGFSWLASQKPDGLEYVYFDADIGKAFRNPEWLSKSPLADYQIRNLAHEQLGTVLAGIIGLTLVGTLLWLLLKPKQTKSNDSLSDT